MLRDASVAARPSPAYVFSPFPATGVKRRVRRSNRRMRWLSRSQKYSAPSGPMTRPYGLLICRSEKPAAPVPTSVVTEGAAALAGSGASATSIAFNRSRRRMSSSVILPEVHSAVERRDLFSVAIEEQRLALEEL